MAKACFLSVILLALLALSTASQFDCDDFSDYLAHCSLSLSEAQVEAHQPIFYDNCTQINTHNADSTQTYQKTIYCFAHLSLQEAENDKGVVALGKETLATIVKSNLNVDQTTIVGAALPTSLNYVTDNKVTSIQNQGTCGSCWSFASTAMYESVLLIRGHSYGLSEEAALECSSYYAPSQRVSDCSGGYFKDSLTFLAAVGDVLRSEFPYLAGNYGSGAGYPTTPGICAETNRISVGNGTATIYATLTDTQLKTLLVNEGPVMIGVYANSAFMSYSSGVFSGCPANAASFINHAITLVGYDDATSSWLAKNQWSTTWGESGYIRISYSADCGLKDLTGNIVFSSYNTNPAITVSSSLLYGDAAPNGQAHLLLALALVFLLALIL